MSTTAKPRTAVVTGASGGIGSAIALRLADAGADVIVHGHHNIAATESVIEQIKRTGRDAVAMHADLSTPQQCREFANTAWQWRDGVDIWVNNAGADVLTKDAAAWSFDRKLQALWQVDVLSCVTLSRDIGARMKARSSGTIINIGWDQAAHGMEGDSGEMFGTVKGAIMAFTKSLGMSLAPDVRVNCVAPGWIKTAWGDESSPYWHRRATGESLRDRWGTPEDVAAAVCFLASVEADFVNGHILPVNGGFRHNALAREKPQ